MDNEFVVNQFIKHLKRRVIEESEFDFEELENLEISLKRVRPQMDFTSWWFELQADLGAGAMEAAWDEIERMEKEDAEEEY